MRRHRFVQRIARSPKQSHDFWEALEDYLPAGQTITSAERSRITDTMLDTLNAFVGPQKQKRPNSNQTQSFSDVLNNVQPAQHGISKRGICGALTKANERCKNPHPGKGGICAAGHKR